MGSLALPLGFAFGDQRGGSDYTKAPEPWVTGTQPHLVGGPASGLASPWVASLGLLAEGSAIDVWWVAVLLAASGLPSATPWEPVPVSQEGESPGTLTTVDPPGDQ